MNWRDIFHNFVIPFIGGFSLTLGKLISDRKLLSFDESNDIALDMVLVSVGALGALYIKKGAVEATIDAMIGDAFLATILLYIRFRRAHPKIAKDGRPRPIGWLSGVLQLILGYGAIVWTILAF